MIDGRLMPETASPFQGRPSDPTDAARLAPAPWKSRLVALALGVLMLTPVVIGAFLRPDGRGVETHTQLGLPPCGWMLKYGKPCATCGMTTAVSEAAHGRLQGEDKRS